MYPKTLDRAFRAIFIVVLVVGMMGVPEARVRAGSALGLGGGLLAEYRDLGGSTVIKTVNGEGPINHGWNGSCPDTNMYQNECGPWAGMFNAYSVLEETLTGYIEAPATGHYVFQSWIDDYLEITINGVTQIADDIGGAVYSIETDLVEGGFYPVTMNYKNRAGSADVSLFWTLPDSTNQVVPKQYLYTEAPSQSKVGLVTSVGGVGDLSFNWMANQGLLQAQTDFGIVGTLYESTSEADYAALLQQCATDGNSLCFAVSFFMLDAVTAAANANPDVKFALIDYVHESPPANLRSINFDEKQAGYLAGALAGKMTASNKIGAIGGMDIPPVTAFIEGYRNGSQCANPDAVVTHEYTGTFTDPALGATVAQTMLADGMDIIYGVAGSTGSGAILYSAQNGGWSIGVDVDEYLTTFGSGSVTGSDKLLTSTMKKLDYAVWKTISDHMGGSFTSGQTTYHLAEGGVGLAPYHETDASIPQAVKDYVDGVQAGILGGSINIDETCRSSAWDVVAEGLSGPFHMDFDEAGNLYVANEMGEGVSKITPDGTVSLFSGGLGGASGLEFNASGVLHVSDDTDRIFQLDGSGNQTVFVDSTAGLSNPNAIAFDDQNNLYAVSAGGFVSKFAPDGTLLNMYLADSLNTPEGVVVDNAAGKIYVSDYNGNVFEIDMATGGKTLYAQTNAQTDGGLARDADGNIYLSAIGSGVVYRIDALTQAADVCLLGINSPRGLTFGPDGRLYVTEYWRGRILSAAGCSSELPPGYQLTPSFSVWFNQNKVDSYGWPYQTDVTLTIEDNSTPASPDFTSTLNTGWTPWAGFQLDSQFQLQHGQVVTMTDGSSTRTHTITDLVATGISADTNIVAGTAAAGSDIRIENKHDGGIWRHEIAAPDGSWTANFNVPGDEEGEIIAEIDPGNEFHVGQRDEDGDGTWWYLPVADPSFSARLTENEVDGYEWPLGVNVTITIDDPDNGPGVDFSDTRTVGNPDGEPNHQTLVRFELGGFTLEPYQLVTLTGGLSSRSTIVASLAVTNVNPDADTVSGTADPGTQVDMGHLYCNESGCYGYRREITNAGGNWTANFAVPGEDPDEQDIVDITPGMGSEARVCDADGDCTRYSWNLKNTNFSVRLSENQVHGYEWPLGANVTITIDDPDNGTGVDFSATQTAVVADWDPNQTFVRFELGGFTLQPYQLITLSDGTLSRSTTVANLVVTSANAGTDTISGTADPGTQVEVGHIYCDQNGCTGFRRETADGGGNWAANFSVPGEDPDEQDMVDITPGIGNEARVGDADGDWTTYGWYVYNPNFISRLGQNRVQAYDWPVGTQVTLTIDDPNTAGSPDYTATLPTILNDPNNVFSGTYADFDLGSVYLLKSGDLVSVTGEGATKTTIVADLHVTSVDADTDIITGTAGPGITEVSVRIRGISFEMRRDVTVSGGAWVADFSTPTSEFETYDLRPGDNGVARWWDDDDDMTSDYWSIPNPNFSARLTENEVHGYEWPIGSQVTLTIDDPDNGLGDDYTKTVTAIQADWDPNQTFAQFRLWEDEFTLEPGQLLSMSDGVMTKTHTVKNLVVTSADPVTDTISGTADSGTQVEVGHIYCDENGCFGLRRETADVDGNWAADFSVPGEDPDEGDIVDIKPGMGSEANIRDEDGDSTQYGWYIPNPYLATRANFDQVEIYEWPMGSTVTLEIDDPVTPENPDYSTTRLIDEVASWNPNQTYEWFDLNGIFDIQPGFIVSTNNGVTTKTHTVTNLAFTEMNIDNDTVTGQAFPEGVRVDVWACTDNHCVNRHAFSGAGGVWTVDFATPGTQDNEQELMDLVNGTWVDSSQYDEDGDQTMYGESIPNPRLNAFINGNAIEFYEFGGMDITLNIDDPITPEPVDYTYSGPASDNWRLELGESITLAAGHIITVTGTGVNKTLAVSDLSVTGWDMNAETLSGTAPAGADVWVNGYSLGVDAWRRITSGGTWLADFSTPGIEDFEQNTLNIVNGSSGVARVDDADGDSTTYSWNVYTAWIAPGTVPFVAGMNMYVDLARPSYSLEAWSALNLLYEPFFRATQEGTLLPAAALGHAVSPDGLVYTLTLRDDMLWSDGEPVTAQHYVDGFLRILAPATTTDYASLLYYDVLGAEAFNNGTETDPNTVGITATGPQTLQFTMVRPAAHFPHVLSVPGFFPVRQDLIDLHGDAWVDPANFAASGPYDLLEYDETHLLFGKNPLYYAADTVDFTQIGMPFIPDPSEQFEAYKRGEVDTVIGASMSTLGDPVYNAERVYSATPGVIGIGLNTLRAPTDNPLVRKALAAATNRQALFDQGLLAPWFQKATGMIPPEVPGYQGSEAGYDYNLAQAQDFLTQAGYPGGAGLPTVQLYGTQNHQATLNAVAGQWTADLGISVEVHIIGDQWGYINDCMGIGIENCDYNAFRGGWYMDYFDAYNMMGDFIAFHLAARTGWDDPNYQDWLDAARAEQVPTLRLYDLQQAEQWVVNDGVPFIPVYHPKQVSLVKPGITTVFGLVPYFEQWSYHPPITAVDDAYAAVEDTLLSVDAASGLLANDINSDAEPLWVHDVGWSVSGGTISVANQEGSFTYEPPDNFCGPDSFTYTATDGGGVSNTATVSLDVACVNDAPRAYPFTVFVDKNTPKPITLTGSDADSDPLTFTVLSDPAHGALSGTAPALTYTPALNYLGSDSFTFKVNDGALDSLTATITIQVTNVIVPVLPSSFYGEVHILDNTPPAGNYVEAYIPGVSGPVANAVLTNYAGTLIYNIDVPAGAQGSALEGAVVTFKVEDRVVATGIWHSGMQQELNLHPPQAQAGGPYAGDEGSSISIAALSSDWGTDALTYQWDWDNNGLYDATGQNQSRVWSDDGSYPVTLKVTDAQGGVGIAQFTVTVHEVPPSNVSAGGPYNGTAGQPVSLGGSATCVPGDGCTFAWDLDNDSFFDDATGLSASRTWNEAGDYTVSLQVSDDDGNVLTSSADVHITGAVHSLALVQGWNLVSFNVHPAEPGVAAVLASVAGNYDLVYAWDATGAHAGSGNWLRYAPALPPALNTLTALDEKMGFWIHMTAADTLEVTGNVPVTTSINLSTAAGGWNLVSYPASVNRDLPNVLSLNGLGTDFSLVYSYRANDVGDPWKLFNRTIPPQFNDLTVMSPGWGYWVKVSVNHTWSVNYLP